jgi:hypothetical protein
MATKMKMVNKGGKMVPAFAADGKGKMSKGGITMKKMGAGGMHMMPDGSMMKNSMMKLGGMTNSNAKVTASKVAKGTVGGKSTAPKSAVPKAGYGMTMKKGGAMRGKKS